MSLFLDFLTFIFLLEEGITVDVLYTVCVVGGVCRWQCSGAGAGLLCCRDQQNNLTIRVPGDQASNCVS